jgi:integrase
MNIDQRIKAANSRLKKAYSGVKIERVNSRLYIRGIFPPKPSSEKFEPSRQRISIASANPEGVKIAESAAKQISLDIDSGAFDWGDWADVEKTPETFGDWIRSFKNFYFLLRGESLTTKETWRTEYVQVLKHLPQDEIPNINALKAVVLRTTANSRTRKRYAQSLKVFAQFIGLEFDVRLFQGNYSPSKRSPRILPSDHQIEKTYSLIRNPYWRWVYGMLATYGLRGHEVFFLDLSGMLAGDFHIKVLRGKTGHRIVFPFHADWIDLFNLTSVQIPQINLTRSNTAIGNTVTQFFGRLPLPFKPYDLRHAWAVRTLQQGLDLSLAAQQMGHSLKVHTDIYHAWISEQVHKKAFRQIYKPKP